MDPKNVVVSAFTRLRASNLGRAVTTKIYHRIRNVKNAERSEESGDKAGGAGRERKEKKKEKHEGGARGREAGARQLRVVEGKQDVDP